MKQKEPTYPCAVCCLFEMGKSCNAAAEGCYAEADQLLQQQQHPISLNSLGVLTRGVPLTVFPLNITGMVQDNHNRDENELKTN
jgi:hypothetical protein